MRWRLYIFLLSATAAFCFMLLTAVTDYGPRGVTKPPLISAAIDSTAGLASAILPVAKPAMAAPAVAAPRAFPKVIPARLYAPASADPVMARREAELDARINQGKPAKRRLLKWDGNGWHREEVALVTAYCPCPKCCGRQAQGITSIGKDAWTPGLATDPIYLDYGTRVQVPGYGLSTVDDTGGAMRRHWRQNGLLHIDVRMTYHYEARQWGKQYLRVKIYDED